VLVIALSRPLKVVFGGVVQAVESIVDSAGPEALTTILTAWS